MPKIRAVFFYKGIWSDDSYDIVHSRYPAKEFLALANPYADMCHGVIGCEEDGGFAETVYDYPGLVRDDGECRRHLVATEPAEHDCLVFVVAMPVDFGIPRRSFVLEGPHPRHAIEAIFGCVLVLLVPGAEVVEAVVVRDGNGG